MDDFSNANSEFYKNIVLAYSTLCISMHLLDLEKGDYTPIKTNEHIENLAREGGSLQQMMTACLMGMAEPECAYSIKDYTNLSTLPERLMEKNTESLFFHGRFHGWCRAIFIKMPDEDTVKHVLFIVTDVDKEVKQLHELERLQKENKQLLETVNALMEGYSSVCRIDFETDKLEVLRIHERVKEALGLTGKKMSYKAVSMFYINNGVAEEDREGLAEVTKPEYIMGNIKIGGFIKKCFHNNLGVYGELKIVRIDENTALFGFAPLE